MKNETWIDLSKAVVVCPEGMSAREQKAVTVLLEEVEKRTRLQWRCVHKWPAGGGAVVAVLPRRLLATVAPGVTVKGDGKAAEGFSVRSDAAKKAVYVIGNDERGVLFGVGWLLRHLRLETTSAAVAAGLDVATAPHYRLRGHQVSYRDKVNSYDGWDVPQWEQYIRDLAIFGSNCFEMIPPRSDDKDTSVHFPRPPLEMMAKVSQVADEYGIDVWLWYPAMDDDYSDPATVEFALKEWGEVLGALPRVDAILVPGGDPGNTPPRLLFPMLAKQAAQLKKIHPNAAEVGGAAGLLPGMDGRLPLHRARRATRLADGRGARSLGAHDHARVPQADPGALPHPQLPGHHAHAGLPVSRPRLGYRLRADHRPRADQPPADR